ncbi:MAG: 3-isopropylmalate dehydrogenase [Myxococcota bacterium]
MRADIVCLPGDGIGPEVTTEAMAVLQAVAEQFGHDFSLTEHLIGGAAIDAVGDPLPAATLEACRASSAILLGAVGHPRFDRPDLELRPEQGLLRIRRELGLFANLRPVAMNACSKAISPLRQERLEGVDILFVRELTGGIYFGKPRRREERDGGRAALDTMVYTEAEIRRIAEVAFTAARSRRGRVTSVDKANVLDVSRLWREVVEEVARDHPTIELEHQLVDSAAMKLITEPAHFDVIVTGNMFGDILSDEASVLSGSLGLLASASLGTDHNSSGHPIGLYEPIHGSAPDIAGQGIANPIAAILSAAMLLRHSLGLDREAKAIEQAVEAVLAAGLRTRDIGGEAGTAEAGTRIGEALSQANR